MIRLNKIVATYTTVRGQVNAVDGVDLTIPSGNIVGIAGESGCGKSTLLKVIYGDLIYPLALTSGSVQYGFHGKTDEEVTTKDIKDYWFSRISYIPQSSMSSLNPVIRIRKQFVDFMDRDKPESEIIDEIKDYVKGLDLPPESIDAYPHQLSGGMRQRIMVAMGTFFKPDVILADEPTAALDSQRGRQVMELFKKVAHEQNGAVIVVTHDHRALDVFDTIYEMEDGRIRLKANDSN